MPSLADVAHAPAGRRYIKAAARRRQTTAAKDTEADPDRRAVKSRGRPPSHPISSWPTSEGRAEGVGHAAPGRQPRELPAGTARLQQPRGDLGNAGRGGPRLPNTHTHTHTHTHTRQQYLYKINTPGQEVGSEENRNSSGRGREDTRGQQRSSILSRCSGSSVLHKSPGGAFQKLRPPIPQQRGQKQLSSQNSFDYR